MLHNSANQEVIKAAVIKLERKYGTEPSDVNAEATESREPRSSAHLRSILEQVQEGILDSGPEVLESRPLRWPWDSYLTGPTCVSLRYIYKWGKNSACCWQGRVCRGYGGALSLENFKTIIKPTKSQSAFSSHHVLTILKNVSDKISPLLVAMGE